MTLAGGTSTEIDIRKPVVFADAVAPAAAGRTITVETSANDHNWTPTTATTTTTAAGRCAVRIPHENAGPVYVRVVAAEAGNAASAASPSIHHYLANYKASGAKYLACVRGGNSAVSALNKAADQYDAGTASLRQITKAAGAYAAAFKDEIACLNLDPPMIMAAGSVP